MENLEFNKKVYELLKKEILNHPNPSLEDAFLNKIKFAANFAWKNFCGFLTDFEMESFLLDLSVRNRINSKIKDYDNSKQKTVLHYATTLYETGGHTRVIKNWIEQDQYSSNIYISSQHLELPNFIKDLNINIHLDKEISYVKKLENFINLVNEMKPSLLILHNHPDDILPILAKPYLTGIPILFFNHADFVFSLCSSIADIGVSINENSAKINERYRFNCANYTLPIYVNKKFIFKPKKIKNHIKIVIMASGYKLSPYKEWNIFSLIEKLEESEVPMSFNVIGIEPSVGAKHIKNYNSKTIFHGKVINPESILQEANMYIESIPIGTGLGTLEAIAAGCFPIFNPTNFLIYEKGAGINFFSEEIKSEYEAIDSFEKYLNFIKNKIELLYKEKYHQNKFAEVLYDKNNKNWNSKLNELYEIALKKEKEINYYVIEIKDKMSSKNCISFANLFFSYPHLSILKQLNDKNKLRYLILFSKKFIFKQKNVRKAIRNTASLIKFCLVLILIKLSRIKIQITP